jgi:hypothetical protein
VPPHLWYNDTVHRCFQDDLLTSPSISRLRASGVVNTDTKAVVIAFGEGDGVVKSKVRVVHRELRNGGSWSFFLCPVCDRRARVLKLRDGPMCWRCCLRQGIGYRISVGSVTERAQARRARIEKLRARLDSGPARLRPRPGRTLDRRTSLEISLKRALIAVRQDLLR